MRFKDWLLEGSQRTLRQRFGDLAPFVKGDEQGYASAPQARKDLWQAYWRAQEMNKKGRVTVYHMINPGKVKDLGKTLAFLTSRSRQEVSVSVEKGVWGTGLVLAGEAKLLLYYPTDVNTGHTGKRQLIPQAPFRPTSSHHWDEGVIRLSDVLWEDIYVGDDDYVHYQFGGWNTLKRLASEYDLNIQGAWEAHSSSPLGITRDVQEEITELERQCHDLNHELWDLYHRIEKSDLDEEDKKRASEIYDKEFARDYYLGQEFQQNPNEYVEELGREKERLTNAGDELASMIGHRWR